MRRYTREEFSQVFDSILGERLPGVPEQDIYRASAVQKYKRGSRRTMPSSIDHRAWRYTLLGTINPIGGAYGPTGYGGVSGGMGLFANGITSGALTIVTAVIGARTVTISAPALTVDAYAGGLLTMYESGQPIAMLGILSNTATVITLDGPLPGTYTAAATAQLTPGPYNEVFAAGISRSAGGAFDPCVGILNSPLDEGGNEPTAGDFVWVQTWGLCNTWASGTYEGGLGGERDVYMMGDGAAQINLALTDATRLGYQRIGFLYTGTGPAGEAVAEHPGPTGGIDTTLMNHVVFLQIAP